MGDPKALVINLGYPLSAGQLQDMAKLLQIPRSAITEIQAQLDLDSITPDTMRALLAQVPHARTVLLVPSGHVLVGIKAFYCLAHALGHPPALVRFRKAHHTISVLYLEDGHEVGPNTETL